MKLRISRVLLAVAPVLAGLAFLPAGCAPDAQSSGAAPSEADLPFQPAASDLDRCSTPEDGCACADDGALEPCGLKTSEGGGFVQCAHGMRSCSDGHWGACQIIDGRVSTKKAPELNPGLDLQGLGSTTKCINNPCNPYCYGYTDDYKNIPFDADSGLQQSDGGDGGPGVTLAPNPYWKPNNVTGFRIAPKPQLVITISSIPQGAYPVYSPAAPQFTAEFLCDGPPSVPCTPPKFTAASWSLNSYQNTLIDNQGKVSVIKPVPNLTTVTGSAGGYSDTATIKVVVDVKEAPGIPAATVTSFANAQANPNLPMDDFTWQYPYKDTLFPRGMIAPVIQTTLGSATGAYVRYGVRHKTGGVADFTWAKVVAQTNPPRYYIPQHIWQYFEETSSNQPAELFIQRLETACNNGPPGGCQRRTISNKPYLFCSLGYNQFNAQNFCAANGMNLTTINDASENEAVRSNAASIAAGSWWIGLEDMTQEGTANFRWVDQSPVSFTFWNGGEPNNSNNEDCAEMLTANGRWNDLPCGTGRYFICEGGPSPTNCGSGVRKEVVLPIKFSSEPMQGSVYFWEINNGRIAKILDDGTLVQNFLKPSPNRCLACHSVSADGSTLVAQGDGGNGPGVAFNAVSGNQTYVRGGANQFMAVSPTGKWTIWSDYGYLSLTNSSTVTATVPGASSRFVAPAWSPDGKWVAWTYRNTTEWYVDFSNADLFVTPFKDPPSAGYFGTSTKIVTATGEWDSQVYPSFAPSSSYLVYQRANAVRTRANFGELWLTGLTAASSKVRLTRANSPTMMAPDGTAAVVGEQDMIAYEPTFSPTESGGYHWMVFISNRWYGNIIHSYGGSVAPNAGQHLKDSGKKQMWISAVPMNPNLTGDQSTPPLWLPGQQTNNENMRGYFAKTPCKTTNQACKWDEDCCGFAGGMALCVLDQPVTPAATRHCGNFTPGVCVGNGGACVTSDQCCKNPKVLECIQGICTEPVPTPFYTPAPFMREYEGTCPQGTRVVWRLFSWKGVTPGDSSITVSVQTAETLAAFVTPPVPASVGLAQLPAAQCPAGYKCGDVKAALDGVPMVSKAKLRVTMMLNPTSDNSTPPTLTDWKQEYDCLPSE